MKIYKSYTIVYKDTIHSADQAAIENIAKEIYYTSVQRKKRAATSYLRIYSIVAIPDKAIVLVIVIYKPVKVLTFGFGSDQGNGWLRYNKDDAFSTPINSHDNIIYFIDAFDGLYYETNRTDILLEETTKFNQVLEKTDLSSPFVRADKTCIPLFSSLVEHTDNPFFADIAQSIFTNVTQKTQLIMMINFFVARISFMGFSFFRGISRFPTVGGDQPNISEVLSIDLTDWEQYQTNNGALQAYTTSSLFGFITSFQYIADMLEDANRPYAEKQYSNFQSVFTFENIDPAPTIYTIPVPTYGDVDFTLSGSVYTSVNTFQLAHAVGATLERLFIYMNNFVDVIDPDTNIVTRTITESMLSIDDHLIVFNTDAYSYAVDYRISLIGFYGTGNTAGYDSVVIDSTTYNNGDEVWARIGIYNADITTTSLPFHTGWPPTPPAYTFGQTWTEHIKDERFETGARTDIIEQYELSPTGIIPSTKFKFYTVVAQQHHENKLVDITNWDYAYDVSYPVNNELVSVSSITEGSDSLDGPTPPTRTVVLDYDLNPPYVNPYYSWLSAVSSGSGDFGAFIISDDNIWTWASISVVTSLFNEFVLIGQAQSYESGNEAGIFGYAATYRSFPAFGNITSSDYTEAFNPINQTFISYGTEGDELGFEYIPATHFYNPDADLIHGEREFYSIYEVFQGWQMANRPVGDGPATIVNYYDDTTTTKRYAFKENKSALTTYWIQAILTYGSTQLEYGMRMLAGYHDNLLVVQDSNTAHYSRYHFIDKNFNRLGQCHIQWNSLLEKTALQNVLSTYVDREDDVFNIYQKYKNTDPAVLPLEEDDITSLTLVKSRRETAETLLTDHVVFNDYASMSLMRYCIRSVSGTNFDSYIMIEGEV